MNGGIMNTNYTYEQNVEETLWALKDMSDNDLRSVAEMLVDAGQGALGSYPGNPNEEQEEIK